MLPSNGFVTGNCPTPEHHSPPINNLPESVAFMRKCSADKPPLPWKIRNPKPEIRNKFQRWERWKFSNRSRRDVFPHLLLSLFSDLFRVSIFGSRISFLLSLHLRRQRLESDRSIHPADHVIARTIRVVAVEEHLVAGIGIAAAVILEGNRLLSWLELAGKHLRIAHILRDEVVKLLGERALVVRGVGAARRGNLASVLHCAIS